MGEALFQALLISAGPFVWLFKSDRNFRLASAFVSWSWGILNLSQGLLDSALVMFVLGFRTLTGLALIDATRLLKGLVATAFIAFFTAAMLKGFKDWFSLLPWFAACWATLCQLFLSGTKLRIYQCCGADTAWAIYDIANQVWGHLIAVFAGMALNVYAVLKAIKTEKQIKINTAVAQLD